MLDNSCSIEVLASTLILSLMFQTKAPAEYSEVVFFEVFIMCEAGNHEDALRHLEEMESNLVDVLCITETKGRSH